MKGASWDLGPPDEVAAQDDAEPRVVVTLTLLRAALRRQWRLWATLATVGGLLGLAAFVALPQSVTATTTLLLAHPPTADPALAMQNDTALASTREIARRVISSQGLSLTPDEFGDQMTVTPTTTQILSLTVAAPDEAQARARTSALALAYLEFRSEQVNQQAQAVIAGTQAQADALSMRVEDLSAKIDGLQGTTSASGQAMLNDLITRRADLASQVSQLSQTIQSEKIQMDGVTQGSHVLDPATVNPTPAKRRAVLLVASGVIAGLALGVALVLFRAVLTDRLYRRADIAAAAGVPVVLSVGRVGGRRRSRRRARERAAARLVTELELAEDTPARWALLSVASGPDARVVAASLVAQLAERGTRVEAVDLTESGGLDRDIAAAVPGAEELSRVTCVRPNEVPTLGGPPPALRGPGAARELVIERIGPREVTVTASTRGGQGGTSDVSLVVAEVAPAIGADHLTGWADQAVFVLTSGKVTAERLQVAASLVRASGLRPHCAVVTRADPTDESLGLLAEPESGTPDVAGRAIGGR